MKTFNEYINNDDILMELNESIKNEELSEEDNAIIDSVVNRISESVKNGEDLEKVMEEIVNEGLLGSIVGGLVGISLGSAVMKAVAKVLGVEKGILYDLLTSKVCCAAVGVVMGNRVGK
ncbi:MAG: hypothetical protein IKO36_03085 [Bacteroidaceae bacterium]|nr:hypothetical protein [Bacteroidaceae bacterium]